MSGGIDLLNLVTREFRTLIPQGYNARYAKSGHIVYMFSGALWAVPFDLERLEITGGQVLVIEGVATFDGTGVSNYAFSDEGRLVYSRATDNLSLEQRMLAWVDRDGREEIVELDAGYYANLSISPNGDRLAMTNTGGINATRDVWVYDFERGDLNRITAGIVPTGPIWNTDGESLIIGYQRGGLSMISANGTGQPEQLTNPQGSWHWANSLSADGQLVYSVAQQSGQNYGLYTLSLDGERTEEKLLDDEFNEREAAISPRGQWIAYLSDRTGRSEVYVSRYPSMEEPRKVSTNGGATPRWGPVGQNGLELFYEADNAMMAVSITTEPEFDVGRPEVLFTGDYISSGRQSYDVSPDGQRFLMRKRVGDSVIETEPLFTSLVLVENWFEELKRLAPPDPQ